MKIAKEVQRSFEFKIDALDENKREIPISFSSEATNVVRREWGETFTEILSHKKGAIDFKRIKDVGSVLFHHDPLRIIGPIKKIQNNEQTGRGEAIVGFDETKEGNERMLQVKNGSLKGSSFGYLRKKVRELEPGEEYQLATRTVTGSKDPNDVTVIVENWIPTELTLTPKPWDIDIGVGRSAEKNDDFIIIKQEGEKMGEENKNTLDKEQMRSLIADELKKIVPDVVSQTRAALIEDAKPKLRVSTEEFRDLTNRASAISPDAMNQVTNLCLEGKTEPEVLRYLTDELTKNADGDKAGGGDANGDGTKRTTKAKTGDESIRSFKDISEDQFLNTLKNPGIVAFH